MNIGDPAWAKFEDWTNDKLGKREEWTIVAVLDDIKVTDEVFSERIAIQSFLVEDKKDNIERVLSYDTWDVRHDIGQAYIMTTGNNKIFIEELGDGDATVFISLKNEIGEFPEFWELWPTFINYFDLRKKGNEFVDPYTNDTIVRLPETARNAPVVIRTDYIREYLAARKMILVRQHDHMRYWKKPISLLDNSISCINHKSFKHSLGIYRIDIKNQPQYSNDDNYFSRIVAKDVIKPFKESGNIGGKYPKTMELKDYPKFIIEQDADGQNILLKPNHNDFFHLVYFDPKLLSRYYAEPNKYCVGFWTPGTGAVSYLDHWQLPLGRNDEGLITAWLGDLLKQNLPPNEISHWHAHNVVPRGGTSTVFLQAQLECNTDQQQPSVENKLIEIKYAMEKYFQKESKKTYKKYSSVDQYTDKLLRIPLYNEHSEFSSAIIVLSRMFIEYLNIRIFQDELPDKYSKDINGKTIKPIVLYANWLEHVRKVPQDIADKVKKSLQMVQMVRSKTGVAHRFSDRAYKEVIKKLSLPDDVSAINLFIKVANPLADSLENLCESLGIVNDLWWRKS